MKKLSDCVFDKIKKVNFIKDNYLDERGYAAQTNDTIINQINSLHNHCGMWWPTSNNCEQIATLIRYGKKHCEQVRTVWSKGIKFVTFIMSVIKILFIRINPC